MGPGRFLNHSYLAPNVEAVSIDHGKRKSPVSLHSPRVCLVAKHFIPKGTELRWNYGDLDPDFLSQPGNEWYLTT